MSMGVAVSVGVLNSNKYGQAQVEGLSAAMVRHPPFGHSPATVLITPSPIPHLEH